MKAWIPSFALLCLVCAGCSPVPNTTSQPTPMYAPPAARSLDPHAQKISKALLGARADLMTQDTQSLRWARSGGQDKPNKWPTCKKLATSYATYMLEARTVYGLQAGLEAAQVDDHVICDQPQIYPAARLAAEKAAANLVAEIPGAEVVEYLTSHPAGKKMDDCWLQALREARQQSTPYKEALDFAASKCNKAATAK